MAEASLSKALEAVLEEISRVASWLWERGWAEANAGNVSIEVTDLLAGCNLEAADLGPEGAETGGVGSLAAVSSLVTDHDRPLAGRWLLVSAAGSRFRDLARRPHENLVLLRLQPTAWRSIPLARLFAAGSGANRLRPTSELPTHLAVHAALRAANSPYRAVLHTHPTHLVALTHAPEVDGSERLNDLLWSMLPEVKVALPEGAHLVPYLLPGSDELAHATAEGVASHRVILWAMHGCLAVESSLADAFDLVDILEKAAHTYLVCRAAGFRPTGLSESDLQALASLAARWRED